MSKAAVAVAMALALTGVHAQSSVAIAGAVDIGLGYIKTDTKHVLQQSTGSIAASSLAFLGNEDLGGGYQASFLLRSLFVASQGGISGSKFFGSEAKVGLQGPAGKIELGRLFDPTHQVLVFKSPSRSNFAGAFNLAIGGYSPYWDNSIRYTAPVARGFKFELQHSLGILNDEPVSPSEDGIATAVALHYAAGPLDLSGVLEHTRTEKGAANYRARRSILMGTYDFGRFKAHLGYVDQDHSGTGRPLDSGLAIAGLSARVSPLWRLSAEVGHKKFENSAGKAQFLGLGAFYSLSKRTLLYSEATIIRNTGVARQAIYRGIPVAPGEDTSGYMVGIRHSF